MPRVALTATNIAAPVVNPQGGDLAASTMVYNTATAGTSPNNVFPGYYYWNGTIWTPFKTTTINPTTINEYGASTSLNNGYGMNLGSGGWIISAWTSGSALANQYISFQQEAEFFMLQVP